MCFPKYIFNVFTITEGKKMHKKEKPGQRKQHSGQHLQLLYHAVGQSHSFEGRGKEEKSSNFIRANIKVSPSEETREKERKEGKGKGWHYFTC